MLTCVRLLSLPLEALIIIQATNGYSMAEFSRDRSAGEEAARRYLARHAPQDDLLSLYLRVFLDKGMSESEDCQPINSKSDLRLRNNLAHIRRTVTAGVHEKLLADEEIASTDLHSLRISNMGPHVGYANLVNPEVWQQERYEIYTTALFIEGYAERKGYYLVTENGLERFVAPVAHFVLASAPAGLDCKEESALLSIHAQPALSQQAFLEARRRLQPVEQGGVNILSDSIRARLLEEAEHTSTLQGALSFSTELCDPERYIVRNSSGKRFEVLLHLHARDQSPVIGLRAID